MISRRRYLLGLLIALHAPIAGADIVGKVVKVSDGDTIWVLGAGNQRHKIRLTGIDAPEKAQPFGRASREHLASLLAGRQVRVESTKNDRYGRVLGKVWVQPPDCAACGKTLDANLAQIVAGMAWWYERYADEQPPRDRETYKAAVGEAKRSGVGLWRDANPIPPWAWRRGQRALPEAPAVADFRCGAKRYCREMTSCAEAKFHLQSCGLTSLDGDRNGVPCESLCR